MKAYVKPELYVERFELAQHIAGCGIPLNHDNATACKVKEGTTYGGAPIDGWFAPGGACTVPIGDAEGYCYTNLNNTFGLFTS